MKSSSGFGPRRVQELPVDPTLELIRLREIFLGAKNPGEAIEFLGLSGFFLEPEQDGHGGLEVAMTWVEFQQWQKLLRLIRTDGFFKTTKRTGDRRRPRFLLDVPPSMDHLLSRLSRKSQAWLAGIPHGIVIQPHEGNLGPISRGNPSALIIVGNTLEAILATIYLDRLSGVDHALCCS